MAKAALAGSASQGFEGELEAVSEEELAAHMASYEAWVAGLEARQRARQEALMAGLGATEEDSQGFFAQSLRAAAEGSSESEDSYAGDSEIRGSRVQARAVPAGRVLGRQRAGIGV